jgi:adenylate kinase
MIGLVRERTLEPDAREGFVLDGFPRTVPQAEALDAFLQERQRPLDVVVALTAEDGELVRRLSARFECPVCRRVYNALSAPSKDGRHCDDHPQTALHQRVDDTPETVRKRLEVYREQTAPLADHYRRQSRLREVSGTGPLDQVYGALSAAVAPSVR